MRENLIITSSVLFSSPVQKLPSMTTFPDSLSAGEPSSLFRVCHVLLFLITFSFSVGIETAFIIIAFFYFVKPPRAKTFLLMEVLRFHALIFGESAMHSTAFLRGRTTRSECCSFENGFALLGRPRFSPWIT